MSLTIINCLLFWNVIKNIFLGVCFFFFNQSDRLETAFWGLVLILFFKFGYFCPGLLVPEYSDIYYTYFGSTETTRACCDLGSALYYTWGVLYLGAVFALIGPV